MVEKVICPDLHYIIMPGVRHWKEELGFGGRCEEPLPHGKGDDLVAGPVDD